MSRFETVLAASTVALLAWGTLGCAFLFDTGDYDEYSAESGRGGGSGGAGAPTLQEDTEEYLEEESNR